MDSVEQFVGGLVRVAPIVAVFLAYLGVAPEYLDFDVAIVVVVGVITVVEAVVLLLFTGDVGDEFDELGESVDALRVETEARLDGIEAAVRGPPDADGAARTDGGTASDRHTTTDTYVDEVEPEAPSGVAALGGAVAGGIAGAPLGPPAVLVGGVAGALVGNAVEFRHLGKRKREEIRRAAWTVVRTRTTPTPSRGEFLGATEGTDGEYRDLEFEDETGRRHAVRLSLDDGRLVYLGANCP